jgi:SpoVK/Ycf46/Vps4 family AAA+-type ATPase
MLSSLPPKLNEGYAQFFEEPEPRHRPDELILDKENAAVFDLLVKEHRQGEQLRRHGLQPRNKILFCGPPGCGKTLAAEIFSLRTGLTFKVLRIDALISSFLGETASNLRTVFEHVLYRPSILFLDEFDAIAHTRRDNSEHNEMRRVVNTLLVLIESYRGPGVIIAATNLQDRIDPALWRRFDEVLFFDMPKDADIRNMLALKLKNFLPAFDVSKKSAKLRGMSFADIERVCTNAIKFSILQNAKTVSEKDFELAIREERRRERSKTRLERRVKK